MSIQFFFIDTNIQLLNRKLLQQFIGRLFKLEGVSIGSLSYIFCSDEYLLKINQEFLRHDYYTDIITFNLSSDPGLVEGEVYISTDRVRENAKIQQATIKEEIHRVVFHGALHLCGYKDKKATEKAIMTLAEDKYLTEYFYKRSTKNSSLKKHIILNKTRKGYL
jgi:rRNA maturation RNase YbeY